MTFRLIKQRADYAFGFFSGGITNVCTFFLQPSISVYLYLFNLSLQFLLLACSAVHEQYQYNNAVYVFLFSYMFYFLLYEQVFLVSPKAADRINSSLKCFGYLYLFASSWPAAYGKDLKEATLKGSLVMHVGNSRCWRQSRTQYLLLMQMRQYIRDWLLGPLGI